MIALKKMKPEDRLLFICTRQDFFPHHKEALLDICREKEIKWDVVYSTAELHGVAPLVYSNIEQCDTTKLRIPDDVLNRFKLYFYRNIKISENKAKAMMEVLSYLDNKSFDIMLIKGSALNVLVYRHPWLTVQNDFDVVLKPRGREIQDLTKEERREIYEYLAERDVEHGYTKHHDLYLSSLSAVNFEKIWEDATVVNYMGKEVFVMSPEDMLITACITSCRKRFFRLKTLCDIAEITCKYKNLKWDVVTSKAKEYRCNNVVYAALLITQMTIGCKFPEEVIDNLGVVTVRSALIRFIINYLNQHLSLSYLYPFPIERPKGRGFNLSLILPYATYNWHQIWFHVWEAIKSVQRIYWLSR